MRNIIMFLLLMSVATLANATYDCQYSLKRDSLYCTYVSPPSDGPVDTARWVKVIDSQMFAITSCVNSELSPLEYMKSQINDGSMDKMPAQHLMVMLQCETKECTNFKILANDTFTYNKVKHTVDKNVLHSILDAHFGEACSTSEAPKFEMWGPLSPN